LGDHFWLHFPGSITSKRLGEWEENRGAKDVAGTFRIFEFDVTSVLKTDGQNAVALEIFAPRKMIWALPGGLEPDACGQDMGIWKEVT